MRGSPRDRQRRGLVVVMAVAFGLTACGSGPDVGGASRPEGTSTGTSRPVDTSGSSSSGDTTGTSPPASTAASGGPSAIGDAFAVTSERETSMTFLDWNIRKRAFGVTGSSSSMSEDERADFFHQVYVAGVEQGAEATVDEAGQFEQWGFTALDLAWETQGFTAGAQASTITFAFDDGFDVASLAARFEDCRFDGTGSGAATVYSTDTKNECLTSSGPVPVPTLPHNVTVAGLVPDQGLLIMSTEPKPVADALAAAAGDGASIADHPEAAGLVEVLAADDTIGFLFGSGVCEAIESAVPATPEDQQLLREAKGTFGGAPYVALAIGQVLAPADGEGTIAFLYLDPADADADLAVRRMADQAPSLLKDTPYSDFVFVVDEARAVGGIVALSVSPPEGHTSNLEDLYGTADMTFALCA